jgi:hypothetical protein
VQNKLNTSNGIIALLVLSYSFGIINSHQKEVQKLNRKTRKMVTIQGQHHLTEDTDRLHVPRKGRGRGLMQIEGTYIAEGIKLEEYVEHTQISLGKSSQGE